jgi:hypothetical protein
MLIVSLCIFKLCANKESWNQGVASHANAGVAPTLHRDALVPRAGAQAQGTTRNGT